MAPWPERPCRWRHGVWRRTHLRVRRGAADAASAEVCTAWVLRGERRAQTYFTLIKVTSMIHGAEHEAEKGIIDMFFCWRIWFLSRLPILRDSQISSQIIPTTEQRRLSRDSRRSDQAIKSEERLQTASPALLALALVIAILPGAWKGLLQGGHGSWQVNDQAADLCEEKKMTMETTQVKKRMIRF